MTKQEQAFLLTITHSELGQDLVEVSPHQGFDVIVGSTADAPDLFTDFSDHPRKSVFLPRINNYSTAAGAFQIIERFYDAYNHQLGLGDFSPISQQRIALQMLSETGARALVNQGDIAGAIHLARSRWASFPGAGYGQHENDLQDLLNFYASALESL